MINNMASTLIQFLSFCPGLQRLCSGAATLGESGKQIVPTGISTINNLVFLRKAMLELKPEKTLEVGMAYGASALLFAATHRDLDRTPVRQHIAIDPFQKASWDNCALLELKKADLDQYVDCCEDFSCVVLPRLAAAKCKVGLAYVDGSHLFEDIFIDFYFLAQILEENGIIVFDDSSDAHVKKVLRFIRTNHNTSFIEIDSSSYRLDQGANFRFKMAKFLGRQQLTAFRKVRDPQRPWNAKLNAF